MVCLPAEVSPEAVPDHVCPVRIQALQVVQELDQVSSHHPDHSGVGRRLGVRRPGNMIEIVKRQKLYSTVVKGLREIYFYGCNM